MTNNLPEAPASATAKVKSPKGFSYLFTLRDESGTELLEKIKSWETVILDQGWTPEENKPSYQPKTFPTGSPRATKPCAEHVGIDLIQRTGKDGSTFWSHAIPGEFQADGKPKWCHGTKGTRTQFTVGEYEGRAMPTDAPGDYF